MPYYPPKPPTTAWWRQLEDVPLHEQRPCRLPLVLNGGQKMIQTRGKFFGKPVVLACDGLCTKAFGYSLRPHIQWTADPDDFTWLADDEIPFDAPVDPGTAEGGDSKPKEVPKAHNKWCARACERCEMFGQDEEEIVLRGWAQRAHNKPERRREVEE